MTKDERIKAIEIIIKKHIFGNGIYAEDCAKAIEESIQINSNILEQLIKKELMNINEWRISSKTISTNNDIIKIKEK